MSAAIVDASNVSPPRAGYRRSSVADVFPPVLTVNCIPVEKRTTGVRSAAAQARVDTWRRRSYAAAMLPRISRGAASLCPICGPTGTFLQHVRHRRASGEPVRVSLSICPPNHSRSIMNDLVQQFSHVFIDIGDESPTTADLIWVSQPTANSLRTFSPHQRMNVFPFLNRMMTKANIAKQLNLHRGLFPTEFDFYPETLELPRDLRILQRVMKQESETGTWILKPTKGLQGIGIVLVRTFNQVEQCLQMNDDKVYSVQRYIDRPMLLHDSKWDMRIYVMLESLNPFRAHLFKDGLARFATEKYVPPRADNLGQSMVHLTNYSLNKKSYRFRMFKQGSVAEEECHKRTIGTTLRQLQEAGDPIDVDRIWDDIGAIVAKTLVAMWPQLQDAHATYFKKVGSTAGASYDQSCFHILGFDIMMDCKGKLWLLEVNSNPSLNRDSVVDAVINEQLMESALKIVRALDPKQQPTEKSNSTAHTKNSHVIANVNNSSNDESTDDDDNDNACSAHKSSSGRRSIINDGEKELPERSHYTARLPHVRPMTHMPLYIDLTYSHLMMFNHPITDSIIKVDEGSARMTSTQTTLWRIYASHLWEPKRSSRASARLLHALSRFQPPSMSFGAADAHIIYAQLQSYSTNRTYPWRQAFEFASDCPAMTFSMFCEAVAIISRRWYPRETPLESLNTFLNVPSERTMEANI